jgi:hypothetical protein
MHVNIQITSSHGQGNGSSLKGSYLRLTSHLLVCNPTLNIEFLKQIHVHYNI